MKTHTSQTKATHVAAFTSLAGATSRATREAVLLLLSVAVLLAGSVAAVRGQSAPTSTTEEAKAQYGKLPMSFVANQGQTDGSVNFAARGAGYSLFLKPTEAVFAMSRKKDTARRGVDEQSWQMGQPKSKMTKTETAVLRMKLVGANADSPSEGLKEQEGKVNYFIGNDESKWHTNIPTFAKVKYEHVYAGIDLIYYGNQQQLEYDFIVAPNADYKQIKLKFAGAKRVEIERTTGDLLLHTRLGTMRQHQPLVYQELGGERQKIAGRYVRRGEQIGFEVGKYDATLPLVIDPTLVYSTFLGGGNVGGGNLNQSFGIAVDSSGSAYVTGTTTSTDFPTTPGAFDTTFNGNSFAGDAFVTKLDITGSALVYSTFLGGSGADFGNSIAVDSSGNAYVTGETRATNFPTTPGAFDTTYNGGPSDAFVTKLNSTGTSLTYSTYIGGSGGGNGDKGRSIAVDSLDNAYVTGETTSNNFPTTPGAFDTTMNSGFRDAFVTKLNAAGSALAYSTYLGGSGISNGNTGFGIAVDSSGNAYVTGFTDSTDFPGTGTTYHGGSADAFVTKLNAAGSSLFYSTLLGGGGFDAGLSIAVDSLNSAYITGDTDSTDFPTTAGSFDRTFNGGSDDAFVTKLSSTSGIVYSTFLGGGGGGNGDLGKNITVDSLGNAYVTGYTDSTDYPTTPGAFDTTYNGGSEDAFVTKLNATGSALVYSTFLGGGSNDSGNGIAVDSSGNAYVTGQTGSTDFQTTPGAFDTTFNGINDNAFVTKLSLLQLTNAVSRKIHGATLFDIDLPLSGEPGVECRSDATGHTLVFTFTTNVVSGSATVTTGTGTAGAATFAGNTMTVPLTGVSDIQKITVTLNGVTDVSAQVLPSTAVSMNVLLGDTTGNKIVNASDVGQTKAQSGFAVSAANFRTDVNVNGSINGSDIGLVKSKVGAALP